MFSRRSCAVLGVFIIFSARYVWELLGGNEVDVLPFALQFYKTSWLSTDWYLNSQAWYRVPFNLIAGPALDIFGIPNGSLLLRGISILFVSLAFASLTRAVGFNLRLTFIAAFIFGNFQSLGAGEWLIGGSEAKVFAWGFAILACAAAAENRVKTVVIWATLATVFHVTIGAVIAVLLLATLLERKHVLVGSLSMLLGGCLVLTVAISLVDTDYFRALAMAASVYTQRVAHHLDPDYFQSGFLIKTVSCVTLVICGRWFACKNNRMSLGRFFTFCLTSLPLVVLGYTLATLNSKASLQPLASIASLWYPFRSADVLLPLGTAFGITALFLDRENRVFANLAKYLAVGALSASVIIFSFNAWQRYDLLAHGNFEDLIAPPKQRAVLNWIRNNTEKGDVVLTPPSMDLIYLSGQRPTFVTTKSLPQNLHDVAEWRERLLLTNNNNPLKSKGLRINKDIDENYRSITNKTLENIRRRQKIRYVVTTSTALPIGFSVAYRDPDYVVYDLAILQPILQAGHQNIDSSQIATPLTQRALSYGDHLVRLKNEDINLLAAVDQQFGDDGYWTRESMWYALGLLKHGNISQQAKAVSIVRSVLDKQFTSTFRKRFGSFPVIWYPPSSNSYWKNYIGHDPNWRLFIGVTLCQILDSYQQSFSSDDLQSIKAALKRIIAAELSLNRIKSHQTNLQLMFSYILDQSADFFKTTEHHTHAQNRLKEILTFTKENQGFPEFNSPTYYGVDWFIIDLLVSHSASDDTRRLAVQLQSHLWSHIHEYFNPCLKNLAGPYHRAYHYDMTNYNSVFGIGLSTKFPGITATEVSPRPRLHPHDALWALNFSSLPLPSNDSPLKFDSKEHFLERTIAGIKNTTWRSCELMIGAMQPIAGSEPPRQSTIAIAHWQIGGAVNWLRLEHAKDLGAIASKNKLTLTSQGTPFRINIGTKNLAYHWQENINALVVVPTNAEIRFSEPPSLAEPCGGELCLQFPATKNLEIVFNLYVAKGAELLPANLK